jgi:hypothetical protein
MAHAVNANLHAFVNEPVGMHACADAGFVEKIHRDLFDDASANAAEHVFAGLAFENDVVDATLVKKLTEQESRRAGSDDRDLGAGLDLHAPS